MTSFSGVNAAHQFDMASWEANSTPSLDAYQYLRCRTPIGRFRIDTMIGDAFRYGFHIKEGSVKVPRWVMPIFLQAVKYSDTFGYSALNHADPATIDAIPPLFTGSRGGISRIEEDEYGVPISLIYQRNANGTPITIPVEQATMFASMWADRNYAGHSCFEPIIDDLMYLQKWRMASGSRAREYSAAGKFAVKDSPWTDDEKTQISKVYPRAKIVTVSTNAGGSFELLDTGGLLNDSELALVVDGFKEMIAAGMGTTKADITGANAGEKLGADFNQSSYFMTLEDEQHNNAEQAYEMFDKLQIGVQLDDDFPFNPPREIPMAERVQTLTTIALSYINLMNAPVVDTAMTTVLRQLFLTQSKLM
jgi:hypothetical protein